jgi:hypothetical protein
MVLTVLLYHRLHEQLGLLASELMLDDTFCRALPGIWQKSAAAPSFRYRDAWLTGSISPGACPGSGESTETVVPDTASQESVGSLSFRVHVEHRPHVFKQPPFLVVSLVFPEPGGCSC